MNNIFGTVALLSLVIPGLLINLIILGKKRMMESLALSWISGSIIFTLLIFLLNYYLNIKLNLLSAGYVFIGLTILLSWFLANKNYSIKPTLKFSIFWLFIPVFVTSLFFPVTDWDAVTLFDFRARILLDNGFIRETLATMSFVKYPMYTSLLHYWVYLTGLWTAMPIYPLFTISLITGVYFVAKRLFSSTVSFFIAAACLFTPKIFESSFVAYTNLPYTVILILGSLYIYLWIKHKNWRDLLMGVLLSASTFWVRLFPFAIVNFVLILLSFPIIKKHSKIITIISLILLVGCFFIPALYPVTNFLKWSVYEHYSPYWLIFIALFIYNLLIKSDNWFWQLLYIGYGLVLIAGTYFYYKQNPSYYLSIPDALQRMTMFINIVVVFIAVNGLENKKEKLLS